MAPVPSASRTYRSSYESPAAAALSTLLIASVKL
jgi:hypothetical protein